MPCGMLLELYFMHLITGHFNHIIIITDSKLKKPVKFHNIKIYKSAVTILSSGIFVINFLLHTIKNKCDQI